ncbi:MAG TPA: ATP-binding protein [Flavobacterium sp.]
MIFLDSIAHCCVHSQNDTIAREFLFDLSSEYYYLNEQNKSLQVNKKVLKLAKAAADTSALARANFYIGDSYEPTHKDSAYHYYQEAEKLYRLTHNLEKTGTMMFNKAVVLFSEGNYVESEIELSKALQLLKNSDSKKLLFASYNLMGSNFEKLEDYPNAMKYYLKSKEILQSMTADTSTVDSHNDYVLTSSVNVANIYEKIGRYDKAIKELESIISDELKRNSPGKYAVALGNLGYTKMKSGDLTGVEQMLLEALTVSQLHESEPQQIYKLNNLGEYYAVTGDTTKSIAYLKRSLAISEKYKGGEDIISTLRLLSRVDPDNDSQYKEKYIRYTDSLYKVQRNNRNKYARIEYETSEVENENKVLSTRNIKIGLASMLVIFLLVGLLIYRYIKSQRRELEVKKQQQTADEELFELLKAHQLQINVTRQQEQNRISNELHDGIMNRIYGVRLHLGMLNDRDDQQSKEKRLQFVDVLQDIEKEVRLISHDLHVENWFTSSDYKSLLVDIVEQQNVTGKTSYRFDYDTEVDWDKVNGLTKITINRVLHEALSNANKYADAQNCTVTLTDDAHDLRLTIADDGKGFETDKSIGDGIGLKNMKDRARSINGRIQIKSEPGKGTQVELTVKL